jgi:protein-disulfide isomerase
MRWVLDGAPGTHFWFHEFPLGRPGRNPAGCSGRIKVLALTRRQFIGGAVVLVLGAGAVSGAWWRRRFSVSGAARAETASSSDLKAAGPLGDEAQGKPDAPVTIIEYASMTCPHCANFDVNVYPLLKSRYIDTGKVRYILREFPLDPLAAAGFMLARCAGNGKFFGLVDVLFRRQSEWMVEKPLAPLLEIAKQAGFTEASFDACLANRDILKGIDQVRERAATELGVEATPTFFINGKMYRGEMTMEQMEGAIKHALGGGNATS